MAKLIVVQGSQEQVLALPDGIHTIGRSSRCAVYIQDIAASREHCKVVIQGGELKLVDQGSRNGTLLNGRRAGTEPLKPGDVIRIGDTMIHIEFKRQEGTRLTPETAPSGQVTTTRARAVVKDFSIWSAGAMPRIAKSISRAVNALLLLGLAGFLFVVCYIVVTRGGGRNFASPNKIAVNPSFNAEIGNPVGAWEGVDDGVRISFDKAAGRASPGSMVVEKIRPEPANGVRYGAKLTVNGRRRIDAGVWVRSDGFKGQAALIIGWVDRMDRTIHVEVSPFLELKPDWGMIKGAFDPAPGASHFDVGIAFWGGTGRIFVDDVEVLNDAPLTEKPTSHSLGDYAIQSAKRNFSQTLAWKSLLLGLNIRLHFLGKDGGIYALGTDLLKLKKEGADRMELSGPVAWPVGQQSVPMTQSFTYENGELAVTYQLSVPAGRQIDEIQLLVEIPKADQLKLPESGLVRNLAFYVANHEFEIAYGEPVRVRRRDEGGVAVLEQSYSVQGEPIVFGWSIRETSTTAEIMIRKLQDDLKRVGEDRPGLRRSILSRLKDRLKSLEEIQAVTKQIEDINRVEQAEWAKVKLEARIGIISGRPERAETALKQIRSFVDRFEDTGLSAEIQELSRELTVLLTGGRQDDRDLGRRLLEAGQKHIQAGKDDLAKGILEVVAKRWETDEIGQEALRLLESLKK